MSVLARMVMKNVQSDVSGACFSTQKKDQEKHALEGVRVKTRHSYHIPPCYIVLLLDKL